MTKSELFKRTVDDQRIRLVFLLVGVFVFCDFEYESFIYERYAYMGFEYEPQVFKKLLSWLLFIPSLGLFFLRSSTFLKAISALFFVFMFIPNLVLFQYMDLNLSFLLAMATFLVLLNASGRKWKIPKTFNILQRQQSLSLFLLTIVVAIPFFVVYPIHWNPSLFLLGELNYEVRASIAEGPSSFVSYLFNPLFKILLPLLVVYGIKERSFYLSALGIILTLLLFLAMPHKAVFFSFAVILVFYFFKDYLKKVNYFLVAFLALLMLGKFMTDFNDNVFIESVFYRRFLMLPSFLNIAYFNVFNGEPVYFSHSFMSAFIDYPHSLGPTFLVGLEAFNSSTANANNGFFSDSFMNLGQWGMFLFAVFVASIFRFFDAMRIAPVYFGLFFLLVLTFRSSALLTAFLTHGLWFLAFVALFFLRDSSQDKLVES